MPGKPKGLPKTGGRKKGTLNKTTIARQPKLGDGMLPLEYMLNVMRDVTADEARRADMAKSAAPYIHPRLANIDHGTKNGEPIQVTFTQYSPKAIR